MSRADKVFYIGCAIFGMWVGIIGLYITGVWT